MEVASYYICVARSPTPSPDRIRSLKAHGVDDPIPVAIYHTCGLLSFITFAACPHHSFQIQLGSNGLERSKGWLFGHGVGKLGYAIILCAPLDHQTHQPMTKIRSHPDTLWWVAQTMIYKPRLGDTP
eukprot:1013444-Heterocapsa_arctica.AAC.1